MRTLVKILVSARSEGTRCPRMPIVFLVPSCTVQAVNLDRCLF